MYRPSVRIQELAREIATEREGKFHHDTKRWVDQHWMEHIAEATMTYFDELFEAKVL
jgi:hypothetical protein